MSVIQITIQRTTTKGQPEMAKMYNSAFEGDIIDLKTLQNDVDASIERILYGKEALKPLVDEKVGKVKKVEEIIGEKQAI
jgi:hypothetical protein